jgi:hypothetical protein
MSTLQRKRALGNLVVESFRMVLTSKKIEKHAAMAVRWVHPIN